MKQVLKIHLPMTYSIAEELCRPRAESFPTSQRPAIVVVDGGWGAGKTAFARMCVAFFRSESFQERAGVVVEFNAWTRSHTGIPLRDLVSVLTQEIRGDDA